MKDDWQQIGDAAARVVGRLEPRHLKLTVWHSAQPPRIVTVPIKIVEQESLILEIEVTRGSAS